jgi:hypothetical protein
MKENILFEITVYNRTNKKISVSNGLKQGRKKVNFLKNGACFKIKKDDTILNAVKHSVFKQRFSDREMLTLSGREVQTISTNAGSLSKIFQR